MQKKITSMFKQASPGITKKVSNSNKKEQNDTKTQEEQQSPDNDQKNDSFLTFEEFKDELGSWKTFLKDYVQSDKFKKIYQKVKTKYQKDTCYPPPNLIFNAFKLSDIDKLKVVIVGQDPYHRKGQAMGLCFSVPKNINRPPSLYNIYKCIQSDPKFPNYKIANHGDLTQWAKQGVFLINAILSVQEAKPMSHKDCDWEDFTDNVIRYIDQNKEGVVFMLWGKPAQKKEVFITSKKNLVLKAGHPSPLAARMKFVECQHFSMANEYLKEKGKTEIDWKIDNQLKQSIIIKK